METKCEFKLFSCKYKLKKEMSGVKYIQAVMYENQFYYVYLSLSHSTWPSCI